MLVVSATVIRAVAPMRTNPQPGTAVKEPARSIVSRMYRRSRTARSLMDTTFRDVFTLRARGVQGLCGVKNGLGDAPEVIRRKHPWREISRSAAAAAFQPALVQVPEAGTRAFGRVFVPWRR